jgi:hypothetical protein
MALLEAFRRNKIIRVYMWPFPFKVAGFYSSQAVIEFNRSEGFEGVLWNVHTTE